MIWDVIPHPDFFPIPDSGGKKAPDPGSAKLNFCMSSYLLVWGWREQYDGLCIVIPEHGPERIPCLLCGVLGHNELLHLFVALKALGICSAGICREEALIF